MKLATLVLFSLTAFAQTNPSAAPRNPLDKAKLEAYLRHLELWIPQVNVKIDDPQPAPDMPGFDKVIAHLSYNTAATDLSYYVSRDGQKIFKGEAYDLNKSPFQANVDKLHNSDQPSYGAEKATISLAVFGDFQCPYCKEEATVLRKNVMASFPDKVRVYFYDFPLDNLHPWARPASIAGRCLLKQGQETFWKYHDWVYEHQTDMTKDNFNAKLTEWAAASGADTVQLGRCVDTKATEAEVNRSVAEGRSLGVDATPTLYLNGRKLVDNMAQWQALQQLIQMEADHQVKAAAEAEKCCVVEIPKVVK